MTLSASLVSNAAELEHLVPAWQALLERSATNEPTLSPTWLLGWWRIFGPQGGRELQAITFYRGDRLVGLAPLLRRLHWYWPGIPFRRLEPLASGEAEADETCSDYLNIIAERGEEAEVYQSLARSLAVRQFGPCDEFCMPGMDGSSSLPTELGNALRQAGFRADMVTTTSAPFIPLPSSWQEYLGQLSSSHRYVVKRSLRDFEKWAGKNVTFEMARTESDLERGKRVLHDLHEERWQSEGRPGVFRSERFTSFHNELMLALLRQNALELQWMSVAGEAVAVLYNIVWNGKVYFYQSGRKTDVPKQVRPGIVIHAKAIQSAIEAGRREYDFLAGASRYKSQLSLASRPLVEVRAYRPSLRESARRMANAGMSRLRALREVWTARPAEEAPEQSEAAE